ncbi:hypothetical protein Bca52824_032933 [Brassica carinata]|uniref:Uncharacterized protein n=1 Tax=Brassica carinata TaxID=52824 RepID=A0A8X7SDE4_BRACI|nr:hypothetical protein Bca52824_032933 [Brassica carinata]
MSREEIKQGFKDMADAMRDGFGMCLQEMKLLGDRIEAVEKKVGTTKKAMHLMIFNSLLQARISVKRTGVSIETSPKITVKIHNIR